MHPELSREKFNAQVRQLLANPELLVDRSWLVLGTAFPHLTLAIGHRKSGKIRVFDFDASDWNDTPLSLKLVDAQTGADLPGSLWPGDSASHWHRSGWISSGGIVTSQPFMCMVGIREYHTHAQHRADRWENYKNVPGHELADIVAQVAEVFQSSNV